MFEKLVRFLVERSGKEYTGGCRTVATVLGATLFLGGWPAGVWFLGYLFGGVLFSQKVAHVLSAVFFILGIPWVVWAVTWQLWRGKGTPVPLVPTKNFLQTGPYRYCRNPMVMGFFLYLTGWAALFNQAGSYAGAIAIVLFLIFEIILVEEKELEARFGDAYRQYKKEVPFIIPRLPKS